MNHLDDSRLEEGRASAPEETYLACSGRLSVLARQLDSSWRYSRLPCPQTTSHLCYRSLFSLFFRLSSSPGRRSVSPISRFQGVPHGKVVIDEAVPGLGRCHCRRHLFAPAKHVRARFHEVPRAPRTPNQAPQHPRHRHRRRPDHHAPRTRRRKEIATETRSAAAAAGPSLFSLGGGSFSSHATTWRKLGFSP